MAKTPEITPPVAAHAVRRALPEDTLQRSIEMLAHLALKGEVVLYKGSPVVHGVDKKGEPAYLHKVSLPALTELMDRMGVPRRGLLATDRGFTIDPKKLKTLDGCHEAATSIIQAQLAGLISDETARALRETIALAIAALSAQKDESKNHHTAPPKVEVIKRDTKAGRPPMPTSKEARKTLEAAGEKVD